MPSADEDTELSPAMASALRTAMPSVMLAASSMIFQRTAMVRRNDTEGTSMGGLGRRETTRSQECRNVEAGG